ncbi:sirohydrochlorin chelatase [Actinomadura rupiterrae]|uniref:sirohydrochlorin chelatase n=1 Tax=Actinomadura rupiterrae TaxID=559627 RepID=UPI0020A3A8C4|nr:hypothetical protein [Actinomadura rupiterrae]MCP2340050.1 sirohydrochlorin ferrochelatase [Actinomadura rupiterrae]
MTPESQASEALPSRRSRALRGGRHRGDESFLLPPGSPALVLAVPGPASGHAGAVAAELARDVELENTGQPALVASIGGGPDGLGAVLSRLAPARPDEPAAVVVPLITGPDPAIMSVVAAAVATAPVPVVAADPLGPHPLIAEALHDRLAESGLARADRIRMMTMVTEAGGVVVAAPGDASAVRQAEITSVLLASRLACPVFTASLDDEAALRGAADQLRASGVRTVALAPHLIGPEVSPDRITRAAAAVGGTAAHPLGAHPALARLAALRYAEALASALAS